jgi:ketosteroid isomerase-like protein
VGVARWSACGDTIKSLTPSEDIELFLRGMDAMNRFDDATLLEMVDERSVFEPLRSATEGAFIGLEGMRRFLADTVDAFDLFKATYTDVRDLGNGRLLAIGTLRMRGRSSGVESDIATAAVVEFRDGVLVHYKDYGDPRLAREAAGLPA